MSDAISTRNIWPYYSSNNTFNTAEKNDSLGKNEFLKILMTQLSNQDPMQPMQDREFIAQMAQFTAVEQMTNMAADMRLLRQSLGMASTLIGKEIQWITLNDKGEKVTQSGVVTALTFKDGVQYAVVGEHSISMDQIIQIGQPGEENPPDEVENPGGGEEETPGDVEEPDEGGSTPGGGDEPEETGNGSPGNGV